MPRKRKIESEPASEDPRYHDTWRLLKIYRDVVWNMELSVHHLKNEFEIEYGTSVEDFLESVSAAGGDLSGTELQDHARCIKRSSNMVNLICSSVDLVRQHHKHGEAYYWVLYYTFLSPQALDNVQEIMEQLRPHIRDISIRTYYNKRKQAVDALGSVLWGYTSKESVELLNEFFPEKK